MRIVVLVRLRFASNMSRRRNVQSCDASEMHLHTEKVEEMNGYGELEKPPDRGKA